MAEGRDGDLLDTPDAGPAAIRGGVVRVVGFALGALVNLVAAAVLFRHLGVADSGRYVTVQSIALLAAGITDAGLAAIGVREFAVRSGEDRVAFQRDLLGLRIGLTLLGLAVGVGFAIAAGYESKLVAGTAISSLALVFVALQHAYSVGLTTRLRLGWVTLVELVRQVATAAAVGAFALAGAALLPFFWAGVIGSALAVLAMIAVRGPGVPLRPSWNATRWRALLADTLTYSLASVVSQIYLRIGIVLVSLIATEQEAGYFGASFRAVEVLIVIPALLVGAAFPVLARAARDDRERLAYACGKILDASIILGAGLALVLGVGAVTAMRIVGGTEFLPADDVLRVHGIGLFFAFCASGLTYTALSMRRHADILKSTLLSLAVCAVLVPILTDAHGAVGAAVATTISDAVLVVALAFTVIRAGVPVRVDRGGLARTTGALLIGLAPAALPGVVPSIRAVLCGVVYVAALFVLRALPQELRDHLPTTR